MGEDVRTMAYIIHGIREVGTEEENKRIEKVRLGLHSDRKRYVATVATFFIAVTMVIGTIATGIYFLLNKEEGDTPQMRQAHIPIPEKIEGNSMHLLKWEVKHQNNNKSEKKDSGIDASALIFEPGDYREENIEPPSETPVNNSNIFPRIIPNRVERNWGFYFVNNEKNGQLEIIPCNLLQIENKYYRNIISRLFHAIGLIEDKHPHPEGIDGIVDMVKNVRIPNIVSIISGPDFKSEKLFLEGNHAKTCISGAHPVFRFYSTDQKDSLNTAKWYSGAFSNINNLADFLCVKLKSKKDKRIFPKGLKVSGLFNFWLSSDKGNTLEFKFRNIGNNAYEITFPEGLETGEYCFFYKDYENSKPSNVLVAFDFSVE